VRRRLVGGALRRYRENLGYSLEDAWNRRPLPDAPSLGVVYLEALSGGVYLEDQADVARYIRAFALVRAAALTPAESASSTHASWISGLRAPSTVTQKTRSPIVALIPHQSLMAPLLLAEPGHAGRYC
jgi:Domain of unknown function (DUF5753)